MTDVLDVLRAQLLAAERTLAANGPPSRRTRGRPVSARVVLASLLIFLGGSAVTVATQPWAPLLAHRSPGAPISTTSDTAPPATELGLLSVLRRAQDSLDRSATATHLLGLIGDGEIGVRLNSLRLLTTPTGQTALLVSLKHVPGPMSADLCLFFGDDDPAHTTSSTGVCGDTQTLRSNGLIANVGGSIFGLVPDGVSRVVAEYIDGQVVSSPVQGNYFSMIDASTNGSPAGVTAPHRLRWLDSAGRAIGPPWVG
jgi:hypothetical protein